MKTKITYAYYSDEQKEIKNEIIGVQELDKEKYEEKYKGHLTCINECRARIKFTEKKDGTKFFSTWNGEGNFHDLGCPYHVDYREKNGRAKIKAFYQTIKISDDTILRRLKRFLDTKIKNDNEIIESVTNKDSNIRYINGKEQVNGFIVGEDGQKHDNENEPNIRYSQAECLSMDDIGVIKGIWGIIDNVQLVDNTSNEVYGYFNLKTKNNKVNIYFPDAFYRNEEVNSVEEFKIFVNNVKTIVEKEKKDIYVVAYGEIKRKRKLGLNVNVISPKRIIIDNKTYYEILKDI